MAMSAVHTSTLRASVRVPTKAWISKCCFSALNNGSIHHGPF